MKKLAITLIATLLLTSCAPAAAYFRDLAERVDGATLSYLTDGLGFDPGPKAAVGVIIIAIGDDLALVRAPQGASCTLEVDLLDCRLGNVSERVVVLLTGTDVVASATYRREVSPQVFQVFAR
jgi:hypothetical protein